MEIKAQYDRFGHNALVEEQETWMLPGMNMDGIFNSW
jgi:hypothetical protein